MTSNFRVCNFCNSCNFFFLKRSIRTWDFVHLNNANWISILLDGQLIPASLFTYSAEIAAKRNSSLLNMKIEHRLELKVARRLEWRLAMDQNHLRVSGQVIWSLGVSHNLAKNFLPHKILYELLSCLSNVKWNQPYSVQYTTLPVPNF